MKKNKFQKGKTLAIGVFGLAAVAVMGVGFSSWVISFRQSTATPSVNIHVADTEDASIIIKNAKIVKSAENGAITVGSAKFDEASNDEKSFVFDSTDVQEGNIQGKNVLTERLTLKAYFEIEMGKDVENGATISAKMTVSKKQAGNPAADVEGSANALTAYNEATTAGVNELIHKSGLESANYVTILTYASLGKTLSAAENIDQTSFVLDKTAEAGVNNSAITVYKVVMDFGYAWGQYFTPSGENQSPVNPTEYFNGLGNSFDYSTAVAKLTALSNIKADLLETVVDLKPSARS